MDRSTWSTVETTAALRALVAEPAPRIRDKVRDRLHPMDLAFLAAAPFWAVGTVGVDGRCDVSPKGDPAGSVLVLDDRTLVLPDRPGNRRIDGLLALVENPQVGVLFLVPGRGDTLRVNGRATVVRDADFFADLEVDGRRPALAVVLDVHEVFFHCSKAFLRSGLWEPESWAPESVPSRAEIAHAVERADESLAEVRSYYESPSYGRDLY